MASEANRIRQAYLFDPLLAVHKELTASGAKTVTITKNEILTGLNKPDDFILAIGLVDGETVEVCHIRKPFVREPDFGATSVNYDLDELLARAKEPE